MEDNVATSQMDISEELVVKEIRPSKVFIVPYRDREPHKLVFMRVMPYILGDLNYNVFYFSTKKIADHLIEEL